METVDLCVVGAGAAGLATAIFAARARPGLRIRCVDGARTVGAKILVSGGGRCNVTNRVVTERDFWGGSSRSVKAVLKGFPASRAEQFFNEIGVALKEEEHGKLFPVTNRARTVLDALLAESARLGIDVVAGERVTNVQRAEGGFLVVAHREHRARSVVLATGGQSLPKSGSDGFGYELARRLGHGLVPLTPALVPLLLGGEMPARLAGVSHPAAVTVDTGDVMTRLEGALLWTHVGISGPVVLDASRHWHRAMLGDRASAVSVRLSVLPHDTFESLERRFVDGGRQRPRATVGSVVAADLPAAVAQAFIAEAGVDASTPIAQLPRESRRALVRALLETTLRVTGSRGYAAAEATAGGVPLEEIDAATMASRVCPGLYLVGEILDVDGRLGGFNFQWAWSSGWVAGNAIGRSLASPDRARGH